MATEQKREQQTPPREPRQPGPSQDERWREEGPGRERSEERTAKRETTEPARER